MPSPTYALTRPSSQSDGAVRAWNASSAAVNGSIAWSGCAPSAAMCSQSSWKWPNSATAISPSAALSASDGASAASSDSRKNATSSA